MSRDRWGMKLALPRAEDESVRRLASILLIVAGLTLLLAGIAMPFTSHAELWYAPVVVGAVTALLGALLVAGGRSLVRERR